MSGADQDPTRPGRRGQGEMEFTLRKATLEDTEDLARVHRESIRELCAAHYSADQIRTWTGVLKPEIYAPALEAKVFLVAESDQGILGLGMLDLETAEISAIYLAPRAAGQGLGRSILQELERTASAQGLDRLTVHATLNAEGFYRSQGYKPVERTFHSLPNDTRLECVRMEKDLSADNG